MEKQYINEITREQIVQRIVSGAGYAATNGNSVFFTLASILLDNGDEIVSTPLLDDFLIPISECE